MFKSKSEISSLKSENKRLRSELETLNKSNIDKNFEQDVKNLIQISMHMKYLLEQCRSQTMIPIDLGKQIDKVLKDIENYS